MSLFGKPTAGTNLFGSTTPSTTQAAPGSLFGSSAPATTAAPPSLNLFGSTPTSTATSQLASTGTSLFGGPSSTGTNAATPTPNLFGSSATTTAAPTTPSLFSSATTTTSAPTTPSLFGSATTTPSATGGLFGTAAAAPTTTTGGGGLFAPGASATTTAPSTGGMFGSAPGATPSSAAGGGLFGGATPASATGSCSGGLFGNATPATTTASTGGGLFGTSSTTTQPTTPGTGLGTFSSTSATAPKPSLFGTSTAQPATQSQQAVKIDWNNLAPYHKFQELGDPVRELVEKFDNYVRTEVQRAEGLAAAFPEHREMIKSVGTDTELLQRKLYTTHIFLESDAKQLARLEELQKQDDQHASLSVRTLDILRLPHAARVLQASQYGISQQQQQTMQQTNPLPPSSTTAGEMDVTSNTAMISYFNKNATEMEKQLHVIVETVGEVEASLKSVEEQAIAATRERRALDGARKDIAEGRQGARQLISTLKEFNDALYDVSVRLVDAKEGLRQFKQTRPDSHRGHGMSFGSSIRR